LKSKSNENSKANNQNRFISCCKPYRKRLQSKRPRASKISLIPERSRKYFEGFIVKNISRTDNSDAGEIAKAASQKMNLPQDVFFQILT
jgi:hypothetical protein